MSSVKLALSRVTGATTSVIKSITTLPNGKSIKHYLTPYSGYIYLLKHPNRYVRYMTIPYCALVFGLPGYFGFGLLNQNKEKTAAREAARKEKIIRTMGIEKDLRYAEEQA